jgi:hypothetical protein
VIRVINGVFSIRKDWYAKNHIQWDEDFWQVYANRMATTLFKLHWSPPGRGLWAMGTDFVYERGSMALQNCGLTTIGETISGDISWLMDALMLGVGVGFIPIRDNKLRLHNVQETFDFVIPDSREGWCESVRHMIDSFVLGMPRPRFIYDKVRPKGSPIRGFGGVSSGPEPLMWYHGKIVEYGERFQERKDRDSIWLKTCLANAAGCCVVAGNVRRSAELGAASITDPTFKDLKRYDLYPERADIGWMSNNSVFLDRDSDFEYLGEIADRARQEADVGYINRINLRHGRIGKLNDHSKPDNAIGFNPCITGEIKLCAADGRGFIRIDSLIGEDLPVYCVNEKDEICIRMMRNVRKTGIKQKILKVVLDSGDTIRVTPNHKFMLRDRSFKEAQHLSNGDSVAIFTRYNPIDCEGQSRGHKYISVGFGGELYYEHDLIAGKQKGYHIHHKDSNRFNNHPDNLLLEEEFDHLSNHSRGEVNPNYSGWSHQEILNFGIALCKKLGRRFSTKEWRSFGPVSLDSKHRYGQFGSHLDFSTLCADMAEVRNDPIDPRTLRILQKMESLGYDCEIINDTVHVLKICEACDKPFWIDQARREQALCSMGCINTVRDYSKNVEGQRKFFAERRKNIQEKQIEVFLDLRFKLQREPLQSEWKDACKDAGVSFEIRRSGSPFQSWNQLRFQANTRNHKVVMVLEDGEEDVYNGTVDQYHNFVIGGWVEKLPSGRISEKGIFSPQCGEQPLADKELCTLAETMPTVCNEISDWYAACEYATMYATTVTLLPTHSPETNKIMAKNRRIGVSIIDYTGWKHKEGVHRVTRYLRAGFKKVREIARISNEEAGIPLPIRHTTMKPGGTIPKLPGKTPGMNHPTSKWTLRRVRVGVGTPIARILDEAGIPSELDVVSMNTLVYEWPIIQGPARPAEQVTVWEQAMNLILLQREWSDNAVSNTLYFKPRWILILESKDPLEFLACLMEYTGEIEARRVLYSQLPEHIIPGRYKIKLEYNRLRIYEYNPDHEEHDIEAVLSAIAPVTKSVSLLPHSPKGVYPQMPEEGISKAEYEQRKSHIKSIDWSKLKGSDGEDEKYCQGDVCVIPTP